MAKPRVALISPHSLSNYAKCLAAGFSELEDPVPSYVVSPELLPSPEPKGAETLDEASVSIPPEWRAFLESSCTDVDVLVVQLHGAHSEVPVLLAAWDYLCSTHGSGDNDLDAKLDKAPSRPLIVLLHRPEEIMERLSRGLYPSRLRTVLFSPSVALVLLGPASLPLFSTPTHAPQSSTQVQRPPIAIPHGFFNCLPAMGSLLPKFAVLDSNPRGSSGDEIAVVGSITTWSDMRWVSDLICMHRTMQKLQGKDKQGAAGKKDARTQTLFVAAGTFRRYKRPEDGVVVDELSCLKAAKNLNFASGAVVSSELDAKPVAPTGLEEANIVEIVEGADIAIACAQGGSVRDQASLRQWLWLRCGRGARVCVVVSPVPKPHDNPAAESGTGLAAELLKHLIDFNVQLYRELLKDFAPKVEYSGTLHEAPGSSVPIVFESPSMTDVASEGLAMLFVPTPPRYAPPPADKEEAAGAASADASAESSRLSNNTNNEEGAAATGPTRSASQEVNGSLPSSPLFYSPGYYPNYDPTCAEVLRLLGDPKEFEALRTRNAEAGRRLGFKQVASQYRTLANSLMGEDLI